jgi:hypothetical protein
VNKFGSFIYKVWGQFLKLDHDKYGKATNLFLYNSNGGRINNKPSLVWWIIKDEKFLPIEKASVSN